MSVIDSDVRDIAGFGVQCRSGTAGVSFLGPVFSGHAASDLDGC